MGVLHGLEMGGAQSHFQGFQVHWALWVCSRYDASGIFSCVPQRDKAAGHTCLPAGTAPRSLTRAGPG